MEESIDLIEQFLRGQMALQEENAFKASLVADEHRHSWAFLLALLLKYHNFG